MGVPFISFLKVLDQYAMAYERFEKMMKDPAFDFVPEHGDQKTGVVGEAFVFEYLRRKKYPGLELGNHTQKAWDIKYIEGGVEKFVQVKAVSAFSKTKQISTIHPFDGCELYVLSLNERFIPDAVWKPAGFSRTVQVNAKGDAFINSCILPKSATDTGCGFVTPIENVFGDFKTWFPELYG